MSDPILPFDFARMFFGEQPPLYLLEILFRTLVIYGYMFSLIRLLGRRSKSHLSILDVLVILALGSAVGDGNFYPEVPIIHCLLVITAIVLVNKAIVVAADANPRLREAVEGKPRLVVKDGIVLTSELRQTGIGLHDLFEMLRLKGICNLGQVDLVVLEPSCDVSIYRRPDARPGLSILPPQELAGSDRCRPVPDDPSQTCCEGCGRLRQNDGEVCAATGCAATTVRVRSLPRYGDQKRD